MNKSGFTLIEVLISFTLVIIIGLVGIFNVVGFRKEQNLTNESRSLVALLKSAQEKSRSQEANSRWGVYVDSLVEGKDTYTLYQVDEMLLISMPTEMPAVSSFDPQTLKFGLSFQDPIPGSASNVIFQKNTGLPVASTTITIIVEDDPTTLQNVLIDNNGKIEVE